MSRFEEIPATSGEYKFINYDSDRADDSLSMSNCSHDLYRDSFVLIIYHFTQDKNGHYRCQLSINNALVQPSHHTQFSAGDCNITNYYRLTSLTENQCVEYVVTDTDSMTTYKSAMTSSVTLSRESSRRSPSVTQQEKESDGAIVYVAGSLGALVIVFGALAIVLSILFICKFQNRETSKSQLIFLCFY